MRFLVLGGGLMGRAVIKDLLENPATESVVVADMNSSILKELKGFLKKYDSKKWTFKKTDVSKVASVKKLMKGVHTVVSAVTYKYNYELAKAAIQSGCHFCDLGGNNTIVDKEFTLNKMAKKKGVTVVPDCGLAPGMVSVLVAHGVAQLDETDSIRIRVGGLPTEPKPPMNYKLVFSVHGLVNEYIESCVKIRDGKIIHVDPMIEVEDLEFPAPFGKLEAFNTSGGTSTLPKTYLGKVKNLDYKTIRYPGHCAQFKLLLDLGLTSSKPIQVGKNKIAPRDLLSVLLTEKLTMEGKDCVLVRVIVDGKKSGMAKTVQYQIIDYGDDHVTAMMRLTSYPIAVIAQMMASGMITKRGVVPQEVCVPADTFISELWKRGIEISIQSN
ncbi:saccharopine dehydrogenase NADP-binding domain-containing protein [bacterium]|nr:saccharopine dehydrogenase NADP-binding domain-containing protein [bacterium]